MVKILSPNMVMHLLIEHKVSGALRCRVGYGVIRVRLGHTHVMTPLSTVDKLS